jgi:hypothetical protein
MFTIKQAKALSSGMVVDEIRGILTAVQEHRTVPTSRGPATVQNLTLTDPITGDWIKAAIWDHQPLDALVGSEVIFISVKSANNRFGGVKIEDKVGQRKNPNDPNEVPPTYKNLSIGNAGVVHTPATYAAIPHPAAAAPAPAPVPAPAAAAAPPAETAAPVAPRQAPVPTPTRAEGVANVPRPPTPPVTAPAETTPPVTAPAQAKVPAATGPLVFNRASFKDLSALFGSCYREVAVIIPRPEQPDGTYLQALQAAAATLFIQACKEGHAAGFSNPDHLPF